MLPRGLRSEVSFKVLIDASPQINFEGPVDYCVQALNKPSHSRGNHENIDSPRGNELLGSMGPMARSSIPDYKTSTMVSTYQGNDVVDDPPDC